MSKKRTMITIGAAIVLLVSGFVYTQNSGNSETASNKTNADTTVTTITNAATTAGEVIPASAVMTNTTTTEAPAATPTAVTTPVTTESE